MSFRLPVPSVTSGSSQSSKETTAVCWRTVLVAATGAPHQQLPRSSSHPPPASSLSLRMPRAPSVREKQSKSRGQQVTGVGYLCSKLVYPTGFRDKMYKRKRQSRKHDAVKCHLCAGIACLIFQ